MCERKKCRGCTFWVRVFVTPCEGEVHIVADVDIRYGKCCLGGQANFECVFPEHQHGCSDWQNRYRPTGVQGTSPPLSAMEEEASRRPPLWGVYNKDLGWLKGPDGEALRCHTYGDALDDLGRVKIAGAQGWKIKEYVDAKTCPHCGHALEEDV